MAGGLRPEGAGGGSAGAGSMSPDLGQMFTGRRRGRAAAGSAGLGGGPLPGTPLGSLTRNSTPREVAAAIIHEGLRRRYSPAQVIDILSDALQESSLNPKASGGGGAWHGIFQQDRSYPGRDDPNQNIAEFYNRLDRHGGPQSPDIRKSIFWLQQAPGAASAEAAYRSGRQAYLSESMRHHDSATALFNEIAHA